MHISTGRKSVICDQHINLELQPWCHYYDRQSERELRSPSQPHSHLALMKETCSQCEGSLLLESWGCSGAHSRGNWYIMKLKYDEVTWQPNGLVSLTKWLWSPTITCEAAITSVTVVIYLLRCLRHSLMILANSFQINTSSSPFPLQARLITST